MTETNSNFTPLGAQVDEAQPVEQIESLCMNCHENVGGHVDV
jgi:hypothetical protein